MNKSDFIDALRERLAGLPKEDIEARIDFYSEAIDDRVEEGLSEEEAVRDVGDIDEIASQIIADTPLLKLAKERIRPRRRLSAWEIALLSLGAPIWLSLVIAAVASLVAIYLSLWSAVISLWAAFASLVGGALGGLVTGAVIGFGGEVGAGIVTLGASLACFGFALLAFVGCKAATKGCVWLLKACIRFIKKSFVKKGGERNAQI